MSLPTTSKEYVFGTHKAELERLGLQHRVWRPEVTDAWRRAGFTAGQTLIDFGCGPGYISMDLSEIVGPSGRIIAVDHSNRFLEYLRQESDARGLTNISTYPVDLDSEPLPDIQAEGAYARWVFAYLKNRSNALEHLIAAIKPGGTIVLHEYFHYHTFQFSQPSKAFAAFIQAVLQAWRMDGGEPDVGMELLHGIEELGLAIESVRPIVHIVGPEDYRWQWPKSWIEIAPEHLIELGVFTEAQEEALRRECSALESSKGIRIVTPAVLEIIARK